MKHNVFFKAMVRRPLKTLIIFLLIGVMTFSFAIRAIEYYIVTRETERLAEFYKPIGKILPIDPNNWYIDEAVDIIKDDPMIDYMDGRRGYYAVTEEIYSADNSGTNPVTSISYVYGSAIGTRLVDLEDEPYVDMDGSTFNYFGEFAISVDDVAVGFPEYVGPGNRLDAKLYSNDKELLETILNSIERGKRYFWKIKLDPQYNAGGLFMQYRAEAVNQELFAIQVSEGEKIDLSYQNVLNEMEIQNKNLHSVTIFTNEDVSVLPDFKENYYLVEGRYFTRQDHLNQNKVCLIRQEMAELRGLKVGDMITFDIYKSDYSNGHWASLETLGDAPEVTQISCEIIGLYGSISQMITTLEHPMIWMPDSCIPKEWEQVTEYAGFYMILNDPGSSSEFIEKYEDMLAEKGYTLSFLENGWETFAAATEPMQQAVLTSVTIFLIVLIIVMALCAVFALMIHKNTWVKIRLLGVPVRTLDIQLMIPLFIVGLLGTGAGGVAARQYAVDKAMETLSALESLQSGVSAVGFSLTGIFLLWLCIFILWMIFLFIGILMQNRGSLLRQLQGRKGKR